MSGRQTLLDKIRTVFPDRDPVAVRVVLDRYGADADDPGVIRVQLAILKLCDEGRPEELADLVETAKRDYRDIIALAETPGLLEAGPHLNPAERARLSEADRRQYEAWLAKT